MQSKDIRETFLKYFESKQHRRLPSSSLIPKDKSVLLTIAGMLQFKPIFLGLEKTDYKRAATCQKCIRVNDIEEVGHTSRHHTFFEMLGNFSFGDYFKEEAIEFAWELLTSVYKLPKEQLKIAIFEDDEESFGIWNQKIGIDPKVIFRLDEENNFWAAGPTGPCGPCSEIYYDFGPDPNCPDPAECRPGCDCERFLEIWNLVFIQFNRDEAGNLNPLPSKNIDTGMGLERISRVMQNAKSNFETDLFVPLIKKIEEVSKIDLLIPKRIVADHSRAITYLIADGVTPSNEDRGYVLRRLIRRAYMYARKLEFDGSLNILCNIVIENGEHFYTELKKQKKLISAIIQSEEQNFEAVLKSGLQAIEEIIKQAQGRHIAADKVFKLHDTYGFPFDLTKEVLEEKGFKFDESGFHEMMEEQRERGRRAKPKDLFLDQLKTAKEEYGASKFIGYENTQTKSRIIGILPDQQYVILDQTPFFPEGGGQVGDTGTIQGIKVVDTLGEIGSVILHKLEQVEKLNVGQNVEAKVDLQRRAAITNHHTATHLLQSALRNVLGDQVKQAGSYVGPDRLRFDFTHHKAMTADEIQKVEGLVNQNIQKGLKLAIAQTDYETAKQKGAIALFDQKYGQKVRVVEIPETSIELCAGCHVENTKDIRIFRIIKEEALQAGVRRIEAVTAIAADQYFESKYSDYIKQIETIAQKLNQKIEPVISSEEAINKLEELDEQIDGLKKQLKVKERELQAKKEQSAASLREEALKAVKDVKGFKVLAYKAEGLEMKSLRVLGDSIAGKLKSGLILLASSLSGKVFFHVRVSPDLIKKGLNAGTLVKIMAEAAGGRGGGKPDKAEAGAKDPGKIEEAFSKVLESL